MTSRINSGQKKLNAILGTKVISPSGAAWVVTAVDPCHDLQLPELNGYPDMQDGNSIVLRVVQELNITAPPDVITSNKLWSFLAAYYPWTFGGTGSGPVLSQFDLWGNVLVPASVQTNAVNQMPPMAVYRGEAGSDLGPFHISVSGNVPPIGLGVDPNYCKGSHRVISGAMELYDTTAVIDRQGTCTVWRQNTNTYDKSVATVLVPNDPAERGSVPYVAINRPPKNIAEANLLPGTRSYKAEEGCYITFKQNQEQLLAKQPNDCQPIIFDGDLSPGIRGPVPASVLSGPYSSIALDQQVGLYPSVVWDWQPFHMTGAFFTGLSPKASFLLRFVQYIERFPTPDEKDIVLLTKPSARHDPIALEMYDQMLRDMPVGVPVAENGLGEWFYDAVNAVKNVASVIPHPLAQAVASGAGAIQKFSQMHQPNQQIKRLPGPKPITPPPGTIKPKKQAKKKQTKPLPTPGRK